MKVCTDACLFGAIVANKVKVETLFDILDIGAGTGLLSLMIAQQTNAAIDAVEIDIDTCTQAKENIAQSPFRNIGISNADISNFFPDHPYDLIISNPPFFEGDLKSGHITKNMAKHDTTLTLQQLLIAVQNYLKTDGFFAILLPYHRLVYCIGEAAKCGLLLAQKILVKQTPTHDYFRGILFFTRHLSIVQTEEVIIKKESGVYSEKFINLLKDYYLNL
jgi:tRNA1Val (adenine37-N6)-methyltransferase